jgi:hypothetical protein
MFAARLADDVGANNQYYAECDKENESNRQMFRGGFVVLF